MTLFDATIINAMEKRFRANFINSLSGYKSANLVGTCDADGNTNLALVSSVVHIGAHPPLMGMIMRPHSVPRDTLENIKTTGVYTINAVPASHYKQAHHTSARFAPDVSEFNECGFTPQWHEEFSAPLVQESPLKIGLKTSSITRIPENNTELVIGEIQFVIVDSKLIEQDGGVSIADLNLASITGLDTYHKATPLAKMAYAKPDKNPSPITDFNSDQ